MQYYSPAKKNEICMKMEAAKNNYSESSNKTYERRKYDVFHPRALMLNLQICGLHFEFSRGSD